MVARALRLLRPLPFAVLPAIVVLFTARAQPVTQPFTFSMVPHTLPLVTHGTIALGDADGDGDLDVFLSGLRDEHIVTALYLYEGAEIRDGQPTFVFEEADVDFPPLIFANAAWGDYDADGDLDLAVSGSRTVNPPYDPVSLIYLNENGELTNAEADLAGVHSGAAEWADYDNDGDLDLLLGGEDARRSSVTRIYRNESGTFVDAEADLPGLAYGAAAFGDADADGDLDLVMGGISRDGSYADVFRNDEGAFTPLASGIDPAVFGTFDWGDYDDDGDLDLMQSGGQFVPRVLDGLSRIYRNSGMEFDSLSIGLPGALSGAATWGDYDNDGDLDLLLMGARDAFGSRTAELFVNEDAEFTRKLYLIGVVFGSAAWGDIDGDGDLDLLTTGRPTQTVPLVNLYENRRQVVTPPDAPSELTAEPVPGGVELQWNPPSGAAATYNVRVGREPGEADVVPPMSDPASGRRLLRGRGNADHNRSWRLSGLQPGTYYWSVQSLDHAYVGSPFAPEQSFTVSEATSAEDPPEVAALQTALHPPSPNPSADEVTLRYDLARRSTVVIRVYDVLGRQVATLVDGEHGPGTYHVVWDGRSASGAALSSGTYVCTFQSGDRLQSIPFVISK